MYWFVANRHRRASAWLCLPARIMFPDLKISILPSFLSGGYPDSRKCTVFAPALICDTRASAAVLASWVFCLLP
jgi:hypothetical protein